MKNNQFNFVLHGVILLLLLIVPYVTTDQIFGLLYHNFDINYLLLSISLSTVLIISFYFNYYFLIPKFLLTKKHTHYYCLLLLVLMTAFGIAMLLFLFFCESLASQLSPTGLIVEKLLPLIITNNLFLWLSTTLSSILWVVFKKWKQTESDRLAAQITALRAQINPHFLFNTLNNIYAVAFEKSPRASQMIDKLSEMMRYSMKEIKQDKVWLEDELMYIDNFIELQRIRLDSGIKLSYSTLENIPPLRIAPMLLIPFIENAFKHGVNLEQESHIKIDLSIEKAIIKLVVLNNKVDIQQYLSQLNGLGINNTKNRLKLIYPSKHSLVLKETGKVFCVSLNINLR